MCMFFRLNDAEIVILIENRLLPKNFSFYRKISLPINRQITVKRISRSGSTYDHRDYLEHVWLENYQIRLRNLFIFRLLSALVRVCPYLIPLLHVNEHPCFVFTAQSAESLKQNTLFTGNTKSILFSPFTLS